jgi:DNA (cytosine-5)-methyltransferase 1
MAQAPLSYYEFFAGGGMARLGLGPGWRCLFANDIDPLKGEVYRDNFGDGVMKVADVWNVEPVDLPGRADLAWASFPCQDLSLAGRRAGLAGERSGTFYGFWRLVEALAREGRAPRVVVLENVAGVLTSNAGRDFEQIVSRLALSGYQYGALEIDAARFTPQSRPRLFFIGSLDPFPPRLLSEASTAEGSASPFGCTPGVVAAVKRLPRELQRGWRWLGAPAPAARNSNLEGVIETDLPVRAWHTPSETERLLALMSERHRARVEEAKAAGGRAVGAVFRRMRPPSPPSGASEGAPSVAPEARRRVQRAEARFDGLAGCLRTPQGGSSRQFLIVVEDGAARTRAMTPRETARLMGLPDDYRLPARPTAALKVTGDGVAVPVVAWLARQILEPLLVRAAAAA